jgi:UDPglucose--hexose-1-phosphate uridylyltransferase
MAPSRAARPHDVGAPSNPLGCPFCPGNEAQTPPETMAIRPGGGPPDSPGWLVRAIPNKFPALAPEEGVHEVILNSPRHVTGLDELTEEEAVRAVGAWAERLEAVRADPRGLWPFLFLNQGAAAGASLQHTHAQLMGLPFEPPRLVARERAFAGADGCLLCEDMHGAGERLVHAGEGLVAWCPRIPPLAGTVRLAPERHLPDWTESLDAVGLARALLRLTRAIGAILRAEAINLWLHDRRPGGTERYHWHVDLVPRLGTLAGLELGAGVIAIPNAPEVTATRLREGMAPAGEPSGG